MTDQIRLTIKGMTNRPDALFSEDGECSTLVNLRCNEGSWKPVGEPTPVFTPAAPDRRLVFVHKNEAYTHYLTYDDTSLFYEAQPGKSEKIADVSGLTNIESIGNTLIVLGEKQIEYALFIDGRYKWLGAKPAFPPGEFYLADPYEPITCNYSEYRLTKEAVPDDDYRLAEEDIRQFSDFILGAYNKGVAELKRKGQLSQAVLVKYALKMYDGNYLLQSAPILLIPPDGFTPFGEVMSIPCIMDSNRITRLAGGSFTCKGYFLQFRQDARALKNWSDIITAIDVFISQPISTLFQEKYFNTYYYENQNGQKRLKFRLEELGFGELESRIADETLFYKVASTSYFEDPAPNIFLADKLEALTTQPRLPLDDRMHHYTSAGTSHVYNGKLHIADLSTRLYSGFPPEIFMVDQDRYNNVNMPFKAALKKCYIETYLKMPIGMAHLVSEYESVRGNIFRGFSALISYPDVRAYRMVITLCFEDSTLYRREIFLKQSKTQDMAYFFERDGYPLAFDGIPGASYTPAPERQQIERITNKLKVSEVNNPFLFPVSRTYTVSNGTIEGMAAASASLSQGQYGEFPLYVFTSEGIWALQTGTTEVAYTNQVVVNREVCNNPASITSLDNSVAYTSERGLMLLEGSDSRLLSLPVEGDFDPIPPAEIKKLPATLHEAATDTTPFLDYLDGASIGYHYPESELLVVNHRYNYYYVFNQMQSLWSKRVGRFQSLCPAWPGLLATDLSGEVCDLSLETPAPADVLIITRAIKGNHPDVYKRLRQVIWRMSASESLLKASVYGSYTPQSAYAPILAANISGSIAGKVALPMAGSSYPYYRIALSGHLSPEASIGAIDISYLPVYGNKLR